VLQIAFGIYEKGQQLQKRKRNWTMNNAKIQVRTKKEVPLITLLQPSNSRYRRRVFLLDDNQWPLDSVRKQNKTKNGRKKVVRRPTLKVVGATTNNPHQWEQWWKKEKNEYIIRRN
jgi:hypothetical protein